MSTLPPPRRPWAVTALAAGLVFLFLGVLLPLGAIALKLRGPLTLGVLGNSLQENYRLVAHGLAMLLLSPLAAGLILRRRALGHRLALVFLGYLTIRSAGFLLTPYSWSSFPFLGAPTLLFGAGNLLINGLLFYLALRPEVFAYCRPDPPSA